MNDSPLQITLIAPLRRLFASILFFSIFLGFTGCSHFHPLAPPEYVYVVVKRMYLRDRVAVVANRVAEVTNGERLTVVEHGRRFLRVKTPQGTVGWIEEHAIIDQGQFDEFQNLAKQHAGETPVTDALLYNELYMHLAPGRKTQHFYLLAPNTKVSLLERASIPRNASGGVLGLPVAKSSPVETSPNRKVHKQSFESRFTPTVSMEDWWLARDNAGHTGWMLSRDLEMNLPQDVAQYSENEKMLAAYVLRTVDDPDSGKPNGKVPEYLTVLTHFKSGLPYDFDQVRVFTWDTRRHRYGTAFRLRDVVGFFPVKVIPGNGNNETGPEPIFSFQVAAGDAVSLDPETGKAHAAQLETMTYRMEGNLVHRVLSPGEKGKPVQPEVRHKTARIRRSSRRAHRGSH